MSCLQSRMSYCIELATALALPGRVKQVNLVLTASRVSHLSTTMCLIPREEVFGGLWSMSAEKSLVMVFTLDLED